MGGSPGRPLVSNLMLYPLYQAHGTDGCGIAVQLCQDSISGASNISYSSQAAGAKASSWPSDVTLLISAALSSQVTTHLRIRLAGATCAHAQHIEDSLACARALCHHCRRRPLSGRPRKWPNRVSALASALRSLCDFQTQAVALEDGHMIEHPSQHSI